MQLNSTGILPLLRNRNFMVLWVSQLITQLADKILFVLQILIATTRSFPDYASPILSYEALVMISSTLPAVLFGSLAGIYVDRHNKFQMMIYTNIMRAIFVFMIPLFSNSFFYFLAVVFLEQVFTQFFAPAEQAAIPLVVDKPNLLAANAMIASSMMASLIIGYGIGSPLLNGLTNLFPQFSAFVREGFVGGAYLLSAALLLLIPVREQIPQNLKPHLFGDLKQALSYVRRNLPVGGAILHLMLLYGVLGVLLKLSMNLSKLLLGNQGDFGFFVSATGVGLTLSALILGQFGGYFAHRPLPLMGFMGIGLALFMFAFAPTVTVGVAIAVFLGLHTSLILLPMQTIIHQYTDENMRGKVFGLLNNGQNIAANLPLILVTLVLDTAIISLQNIPEIGANGERLGFQIVVVGCAFLVLGLGWWTWQKNRQAMQKLL
jgi:MFS family permease